MDKVSKALVIGSGGIKIAEAAEFDYSGSQALKALKEEEIETILVNPNVATVQTSHRLADRVYLIPLDESFVEEVIKRERPDCILIGFGGQSALSIGVSLHKRGFLSSYGVRVLGTPIEGIETALSRPLFKEAMKNVGLPVPPSKPAANIDEALEAAEEIGFPVILRVSFNLGGRGTLVARKREELKDQLSRAFAHSPVKSIIVERYLEGWKEVEFEIMRDRAGNSIAVACLENIEPMGVHTGDSIVVTPSQTLTDREYQELRLASIRVAETIGLIGECNVQLALNPKSEEYYIIETNPRMSRSSALASKATGYPLAYIAAKLALGYLLDELINKITGVTTAFFEPSLDYVVVKVPRWDLQKFWPVEEKLGSEMKSVGEVMAIGRNLEESFQKAFRMLDIGEPGLVAGERYLHEESLEDVLDRLSPLKPYWPLDAAKALRLGAKVEDIAARTLVDPFYIRVIENVVRIGERLKQLNNMPEDKRRKTLEEAAKNGFNDEQIARLAGIKPEEIRCMMKNKRIEPYVKNIDTLAGEYPSRTNYLYLTYDGVEDDVTPSSRKKIIVLGAGVFRIGVSVEFDWAVVGITDALRERGIEVIIVNYNPETVSTDWDTADRLYFEDIHPTTIENIAAKEKTNVILVSASGQLGNNIAEELTSRGFELAGTKASSINMAEDRSIFSRIVDELGLMQPPWTRVTNIDEAISFAEKTGYPVIVRPSYILGGSSILIIYNSKELREYVGKALATSSKPVVISKFIQPALEAEVDCVSDGRKVFVVPLEHVEPPGVHSGDSTIYTPTRAIPEKTWNKIIEATKALARELRIIGPFNIQYIVNDADVYVLEMNLRCSRSMPFSSKAYGISIIDLSASTITSSSLPKINALEPIKDAYTPEFSCWSVKSPQFSWAQLKGCYPFLGPEMRSTGEVASHGDSFYEALLKSWLSAQPNRIPSKNDIILAYSTSRIGEEEIATAAKTMIKAGYKVVTLRESPLEGLETLESEKLSEMIRNGDIGLVITTGKSPSIDYKIRRAAADHNTPIILDSKLAREIANAIHAYTAGEIQLKVKELREYWSTKIKQSIVLNPRKQQNH